MTPRALTTADAANREFITPKELAERLGVAPRGVERWRNTGYGPPFMRLGARRIAYRVSDVDNWAKAQTFQSRAAELNAKDSRAQTGL